MRWGLVLFLQDDLHNLLQQMCSKGGGIVAVVVRCIAAAMYSCEDLTPGWECLLCILDSWPGLRSTLEQTPAQFHDLLASCVTVCKSARKIRFRIFCYFLKKNLTYPYSFKVEKLCTSTQLHCANTLKCMLIPTQIDDSPLSKALPQVLMSDNHAFGVTKAYPKLR
jgi:hypothetical protein